MVMLLRSGSKSEKSRTQWVCVDICICWLCCLNLECPGYFFRFWFCCHPDISYRMQKGSCVCCVGLFWPSSDTAQIHIAKYHLHFACLLRTLGPSNSRDDNGYHLVSGGIYQARHIMCNIIHTCFAMKAMPFTLYRTGIDTAWLLCLEWQNWWVLTA